MWRGKKKKIWRGSLLVEYLSSIKQGSISQHYKNKKIHANYPRRKIEPKLRVQVSYSGKQSSESGHPQASWSNRPCLCATGVGATVNKVSKLSQRVGGSWKIAAMLEHVFQN